MLYYLRKIKHKSLLSFQNIGKIMQEDVEPIQQLGTIMFLL